MRTRKMLVGAWIALGLLLGAASSVIAEISGSPNGFGASTIVLGIGDGPDPIDPLGWQAYRQIPAAQILNADGMAREDGRPDLAWFPSGWPVAVWAWNVGSDRDIAFSEWDGSGWSVVEFLSSTSADDLDPRVFVEADGTLDVVWWTTGAPSAVLLSTRAPGSSGWSAATRVSDPSESARRPSVAMFDGALRVAYERDSNQTGIAQDVIVRRRQPDGSFATEIVARTPRADRLDVVLHVENGKLWIDWKQAAASLGYAASVGSTWDAPTTQPWGDASWVGVEDARKSVRRQVLGP